MTTFINLYLDEVTPRPHIRKHLIYCLLWLIDISTFILRLDSYLIKALNLDYTFLATAIPLLVVALNIILLLSQKWYYSLAFIFYPFLLILWFIPKLILKKGKLYLFLYYLEVVLKRISKPKKSLTQFFLLMTILIIILTNNNNYVRILGIIYFGYLYFKILLNYILGAEIIRKTNPETQKAKSSFSTLNLVDTLEKYKEDEKLTAEQNLSNKIQRMVVWNYFLQYVAENVNGFRGKRAFMILWFFQYFLCFFLTLSFFTFFNYQLFRIDTHSFVVTTQPDLFDFFYYTFKTITFSTIDSIKSFSKIARIAEMGSFFILAIWLLIITISSITSLKIAEYSKDVEKAVKLCLIQNEKIEEHLKQKYNTNVEKAISEVQTINTAVMKLKTILEKIL